MSVKTIRFNKSEENALKMLLAYYRKDFSNCMKDLIAEKLEDLRDIGSIKRIKEGKPSDYLTAGQVNSFFHAA